MLQQEAEPSRMSMLAKVSLREKSLVFFGAELPMLQQVIKNVNGHREQISFFITALLAGLLAEAKLPQARITTDRYTS